MIKLNEILDTHSYCLTKYGHILFGDFKHKEEKDTKKESKLFDELTKYIDGEYIASMSDSVIADLKKELIDIKKCKNIFPKELKPQITKLYRGTYIDKDKLASIGIDEQSLKINKIINYTPHSSIQSWTTKYNSALKINEAPYHMNLFRIVLTTTFPENELLFNNSFLNLIDGYLGISEKENEVIRIGNDVKCDAFLNKKDLRKYKNEYPQ